MAEETLHLPLSLPHRWERLTLAAESRERLWQHDLLVLRVLNDLEAHVHREAEAQPGRERLEAKLDLVMHLLAQALYGKELPPPPGPLTLSADGAGLEAGGALGTGEHVLLTLYLSTALALPLRMPAQVTEGGAARITVGWSGMPEACRDAWEQWLFRQHRRWVHTQRAQRGE